MENYEKKYKSALEWMRSIYPTMRGADKEDAKHYFHELCESEDERIRKELIERFIWELKGAEEQDAAGCSRQKDIAMFKRGLAWLEKQGEQKHLPKWKKATEKKDLEKHVAILEENKVLLSNYLEEGDYYIDLEDLKALPKEE